MTDEEGRSGKGLPSKLNERQFSTLDKPFSASSVTNTMYGFISTWAKRVPVPGISKAMAQTAPPS